MKAAFERTISAVEVKDWIGSSSKAKLREAQYQTIADRLTKFYWPSDPPPSPDSPWLPKSSAPDDRWWDFSATTKAAKILGNNLPKMLAFQKGLEWAPETRDGFGIIKQLESALSAALPYIEDPFGAGASARSSGRKRPKDWHTYARLVAILIIGEMKKAGHVSPGITRNSVVVRVVRKALIRMGVPQSKTLSATAIGAHLTRIDKRFGLTGRA